MKKKQEHFFQLHNLDAPGSVSMPLARDRACCLFSLQYICFVCAPRGRGGVVKGSACKHGASCLCAARALNKKDKAA